MLTRLLLASLLGLAFTTNLADARRLPVPAMQSQIVFAVEQRLKAPDLADLPEYRFELRSDGSWSHVQTRKHAVEKKASGTLSRRQLAKIRSLLRTSWTVTRADITCMAFAAVSQQYSVNGNVVWTDEMCGVEVLDRTSRERLARVMKIVGPLAK